jgi:hypothetical protein
VAVDASAAVFWRLREVCCLPGIAEEISECDNHHSVTPRFFMGSFLFPSNHLVCKRVLLSPLLFSSPSVRCFSTSPPRLAKKNMPPKKAVVEKKTLLGRPGNNLKIGIVGPFFKKSVLHVSDASPGVPNVGKSSFFNALSDTGPSDC